MPIFHNRVPVIPHRPRVQPIAGKVHRSYPVGQHNYSRACQGELFTITITIDMDAPFRGNIQANLVTTMNSTDGKTWSSIPFSWIDSSRLICQIRPTHTGLHKFRTEYSFDKGLSWSRDNVEDAWILVDPPQVDGLRMYTLIPNVSGTITDWTTDLGRIRAMGFNAVHLLPLTTLDTSESPYSAKDLFSVDPRYVDSTSPLNGISQLEEFVEAAKALGIRLCFDLVLNHVGVHSNIAKQAPDWIISDANSPDGFQRARYLADHGWCFWDDLVLINYNHPSEAIRQEIWDYMTSYTLFWARFADITGGFVRFDNLHSSNPDFILSLTNTLHSEFPEVGILAEYFADENTMIKTSKDWHLNLNLATPWDYKFVPKLREYLKNLHRLSNHLRYFMPVTSHDSGSPAQEFCSADATIPRYVAAALMGTGATGIVQGVEFGVEKKIQFIGKSNKMKFPSEARFGKFLLQINSILAEYPVFRQGGNCHFVDFGHHAIIAAYRHETGNDTSGYLVVCNFDILSSQNILLDLSVYLGIGRSVACTDLLSNEIKYYPVSKIDLHLPVCSSLVLKVSGSKISEYNDANQFPVNQYY